MPLSFAEVVERPLFEPRFRWSMGVRSLDPADWLQPDDAREGDLAEKRALRQSIPDEVGAWLPGSESAAGEVLRLVAEDLTRRGLGLPLPGRHPIDTAGSGVQEDLCLMERRGERWILTAGSVCFPTRWKLTEKIGASLAEIHAPVPRYDTDLGPTVDRFFDRMGPGSLVWRLNWSIVGDPGRRLAAARQAPSVAPTDAGRKLFVRVERQTLRRLVEHEAICFGIRIHAWPLADVVDGLDIESTAALLRSLPPEVAAYKNLERVREPLADWLMTHLRER